MDLLERIKKESYQKGYASGFEKGLKEGRDFAVKMMSELFAYVMADKFKFNHQKIFEASKHLEYFSDSILKNYISLEDIETTLSEEYEINFD